MFSDWGSLILQFAITAAIVLALIGGILWFARRYSMGSLGRIGRGRVPRLAIVDAMSVDGRRRLVLVRRDNVEHLILIGGPSDVVVEQAIQRPRRPRPVQSAEGDVAAASGAVSADQAPAPAENPPIPFTRPQAPQAAERAQAAELPFSFRRASSGAQPAAAMPVARRQPIEEVAVPLSPARFVDINRPTRIEPATAAAQFSGMIQAEPRFPDLPAPELSPSHERAAPESGNGLDSGAPSGTDGDASEAETNPFVRPQPDAEDDTAAKVNDLEREMARLLGEITQRHPS
jgi:flagellar protein FliO/FliZ